MRSSLITVALALSLPLAASASSYNAVSDFSTAANPNGVWSYGTGTPSAFQLFGYSGTNPVIGYTYPGSYWAAGPNSLPIVSYSSTGVDVGSVDVPAGELWLHPGNSNALDSIVEFTAPATGIYSFASTFSHDDTAGASGGYANGQNVGVYENGVFLGGELLGTDYGDSYTFDDSLHLVQGDVIAFAVAIEGDYYNDSTGLQVSVNATPEPSSLVLLGTGILGLAGAARRKLRS